MSQKRTISIVVPAFNEEENVGPLHAAVTEALAPLSERYDHELIFVDDGSRDGTLAALRGLTSTDPRVRVVKLSRNFGHQAALTAGMEAARGEAVVTMDCDLQDPPDLIPKMVAAWESGNRVVYARRIARDDNLFKKWTAALYYRLLDRVSDVRIPRQVGDFRLLDRVVVKNLIALGEHARYLRGMVAWLGFQHAFVDFARPERIHGRTHYSVRKMVRLAMDGLLSFSTLPIKCGLWCGAMTILVSLTLLVCMLWDHFVCRTPYPLHMWFMLSLFGLVGVQFIVIWMLGEYVGRIYGDVLKRPLYVVDGDSGSSTV